MRGVHNNTGSLSLEGAFIVDIIFKNYKETLNSENKVTFLNPKNSSKEYFIETGWASGGNEKIKLPLGDTIWKVKGNSTVRVYVRVWCTPPEEPNRKVMYRRRSIMGLLDHE